MFSAKNCSKNPRVTQLRVVHDGPGDLVLGSCTDRVNPFQPCRGNQHYPPRYQ